MYGWPIACDCPECMYGWPIACDYPKVLLNVWLADWSTGRGHYDRESSRVRPGQIGDAAGRVSVVAGDQELCQYRPHHTADWVGSTGVHERGLVNNNIVHTKDTLYILYNVHRHT